MPSRLITTILISAYSLVQTPVKSDTRHISSDTASFGPFLSLKTNHSALGMVLRIFLTWTYVVKVRTVNVRKWSASRAITDNTIPNETEDTATYLGLEGIIIWKLVDLQPIPFSGFLPAWPWYMRSSNIVNERSYSRISEAFPDLQHRKIQSYCEPHALPSQLFLIQLDIHVHPLRHG